MGKEIGHIHRAHRLVYVPDGLGTLGRVQPPSCSGSKLPAVSEGRSFRGMGGLQTVRIQDPDPDLRLVVIGSVTVSVAINQLCLVFYGIGIFIVMVCKQSGRIRWGFTTLHSQAVGVFLSPPTHRGAV